MKFMTIIVERLILSFSGASTGTDGRRNASATFLIEVGYFFPERRNNYFE